jgi:hypothetical protein
MIRTNGKSISIGIKSQVKILTNILEEFLSLGRLEEGTIAERKVHFNIREMMSRTGIRDE